MLFSGFVLANAVPFFSQFLGLLGGLLAGPINFLLPIVLFLVARGDNLRWEKESPEMELSSVSSTTEEAQMARPGVRNLVATEESEGESGSDGTSSNGSYSDSRRRLLLSALR